MCEDWLGPGVGGVGWRMGYKGGCSGSMPHDGGGADCLGTIPKHFSGGRLPLHRGVAGAGGWLGLGWLRLGGVAGAECVPIHRGVAGAGGVYTTRQIYVKMLNIACNFMQSSMS